MTPRKSFLILVAGILIVIGLLWLRNAADSSYAHFVELLYQQVQGEHRAEHARRQANIDRLEAAQVVSAAAYRIRIDALAVAADARVAAIRWKSNEQLRREKASAEKVMKEKKKVEDALTSMTENRDALKATAKAREIAIAAERANLKIEHIAALAAKQDELDTCERARQDALSRTSRRTWLSIGPASQLYIQNGTIQHRLGISIQIPIIEIKSPFKRF
jgi:cell division protein FtsI/penicillin-binding protein 2